MRKDRCSKNTIKAYIADVKKFLEFTDKNPQEIDEIDVVEYSEFLEEILVDSKGEKNKLLSAKTINRKLYAIFKYTNFLNEKFNINIVLNMKRLKMKITVVDYGINILTKAEFKKLVTGALKDKNIMFATILRTMIFTGMRISEVLKITVNDINKEYYQIRGKGRKMRTVPFPLELRAYFNEYMKVRKSKYEDETALFLNTRSNPVTAWTCHQCMQKYARKVKVNLRKAHCHNVRHLFAWICLNEKGMSITSVALLLGHSNINTTKIYLNETEKEIIKGMQNFDL